MKRTFSFFLFSFIILSFSADAQYRRIITYAGAGGSGDYGGDGFAASGALFNGPEQIALDATGNLFVVDFYNNRVRKVNKSNGTIVNFAGSGRQGYTGDGSASTSADISPIGVAADPRGNVYISDYGHSVVRKVNKLGIISTYAGGNGWGYSGDGGLAVRAKMQLPFGLATDRKSNLYIADAGNHVVRKVDTFGRISTVAGSGIPGYSGDGLAATDAQIDSPYALAVDRTGNLYIADHNNNVIRMVDPSGVIYTIAGTGAVGWTGDGGQAVNATFHYPTGVAVDTLGKVYIADSYNNVVRMIDTSGNISTIAGNSWAGFGGDLGDALGANLFHPYGIAVDTFGSVYVGDANNQRVRKIYIITLGVNDIEHNSGIEVFPNPASRELNVSGLTVSDKICIYDAAGRLLSSWTSSGDKNQVFDIESFATGIYMFTVYDAAGNKKAMMQMVK